MNRVILTANGQAVILNHVYDPVTPTIMTFKIPGVKATVFSLELNPEPENEDRS